MVEIAVCQPHGALFTSAYPSEDWVRPFCHGGKQGGGPPTDLQLKTQNKHNSRSSNTVNSMRKRLRRLDSSAHIRTTPSPVSSMTSLATVLQNLACHKRSHNDNIIVRRMHAYHARRGYGEEVHLISSAYLQVFDGVAAVIHGHKVLLTFIRILHLVI